MGTGRREEMMGVESVEVGVSLEHLASAREGEGKAAEALELRERALAAARKYAGGGGGGGEVGGRL